jgi:hypothetical protein
LILNLFLNKPVFIKDVMASTSDDIGRMIRDEVRNYFTNLTEQRPAFPAIRLRTRDTRVIFNTREEFKISWG